ncbi:acyltransferase [Lacibacter sp. MH-610]|uniref:acyltransferase family protein n=1 Tax=Lacibacter sp. MH-610 TaxID=3020883 RepID=UPI003891AB64
MLSIKYNPKQHISALDSIRGVAVLLVILFHCYPTYITKLGWLGVDLFFVLSGFLITGLLLDAKGKNNYYRNFIVRRTLRIFPLYYFALLLCLVIVPIVFKSLLPPDYGYYTANQLWFWTYTQNWLFSKTGFPENLTLVHFWSLAVEEQFYLFWPLFVRIFSSRKLLGFCFMLMVLSFAFRLYIGKEIGFVSPFEYVATLSRIDALLTGAVTAILIRNNKELLEKYAFRFFITSIIFFTAGILLARSFFFLKLAPFYLAADIAFACLLVYMLSVDHKNATLKNFLNQKVFIFLGKYSYGLYVYHYILYMFFKDYFIRHIQAVVHNYWAAFFITGTLVIFVSVVVSILSYRLIELPFLKLKKYFV